MPTAIYADLLTKAYPQAIETWAQDEIVMGQFGALLRKGRTCTPEETKLMRLLGILIQDYDRHAMPPNEFTPAERPQSVLEQSGKNPEDLLPVFGQRSDVNEALRGKRPISATRAKKLGLCFI